MLIYKKFKEIAETYPNKEIFLGQETKSYLGEKSETYFYFLERVNFTAEILNSDITEDYYIFKSDNKFDYFVNFLACNKIRKTFVPIPVDIKEKKYNEIIKLLKVNDLKDISVVFHTSGTTGKSKGVKYTESALLQNMKICRNALKLTDEDIGWSYGSPHLAGFLVGVSFTTILTGGQVLLEDLKPTDSQKVIDKYKPTYTFFPPSLIEMLKRLERTNLNLNSFKRIVVSATKPTENQLKFLLDKGCQSINHCYSATDFASSTVAIGRNITDKNNIDLSFEKGYGDWELKWEYDEEDAPELLVKGLGLPVGYLESDLTKEVFENGYFRTGDIIDKELNYISRKKDIIKSRGYLVSPYEIEECIKDLNYVEDCAVVGVPHQLFTEEIVAFVVDKTKDVYTSKDIIDECKLHLEKSHIPHSVKFIDKLPVTTHGHGLKVSKSKLKNMCGWYNIKNEWAWFNELDITKFDKFEWDYKDVEFKYIKSVKDLLEIEKELKRGLETFQGSLSEPYLEMWDFKEAINRLEDGGFLICLIHNGIVIMWNWFLVGDVIIPEHGWNVKAKIPDKCTFSINWWMHPQYRSNKKYPRLSIDVVLHSFYLLNLDNWKVDYSWVEGWNWRSAKMQKRFGYIGSNWLDRYGSY
tara:strand:+ start:3504 stop:5417 length:1914 start_codon:yes stop_codon:yes gene_type:complete